MSVENTKTFRQMVIAAEQHLPTAAELRKRHAKVESKGENSIDGWHRYYVKKRSRLIAFLDKAIELNEPIACSL